MHAPASAVALVAASGELVLVSGALASSTVLASGVLASGVLASGVPASVVPELEPLVVPEALPVAAPEVVPLVPAVAPLVPALAPVPLPDEVPAAAVLPEDAGLLLLLHAAAKSPTLMPKLNLLRTFIFIPSMSKETRKLWAHTTLHEGHGQMWDSEIAEMRSPP